jgi:hypothetical protein
LDTVPFGLWLSVWGYGLPYTPEDRTIFV